jgi:hypothetical protein
MVIRWNGGHELMGNGQKVRQMRFGLTYISWSDAELGNYPEVRLLGPNGWVIMEMDELGDQFDVSSS